MNLDVEHLFHDRCKTSDRSPVPGSTRNARRGKASGRKTLKGSSRPTTTVELRGRTRGCNPTSGPKARITPSRLDDSSGVEPVRMHRRSCPHTCKRKSPRQERSVGSLPAARRRVSLRKRTTDGSQSPEANPDARDFAANVRSHVSLLLKRPNQPDENQSGRDEWTNRHVGPARSEMIRHPCVGANLRRAARTPGAPSDEQREGPLVRPGRDDPGW